MIPHEPPEVDAGADQTITLPDSVNLAGTVTDDDRAEPSGDITISWNKVLGPGTVVFSNANTEQTTATFSKAGLYLLKLNASANEVSSADTVEITVEKQVVFTDVFGTWKTDYGTMELERDGSSVTGTYTKENGAIVQATLNGRILTGFWVEDSSRVPCDSAKDERNFWGRISFEFSENFNKFTGKWQWCNQEPTENWNGRRN